MRTLLSLVLAVGFVFLGASALSAQSGPPDIVRLRSGGFFRGTLVEHVPGQYSVLQLPSGEQRRFPAADIVFAGPDSAPVPPAPPVSLGPPPSPPQWPSVAPVAPATAQRFQPNDPRVTLHRASGSGVGLISSGYGVVGVQTTLFERLCTGPCQAHFDPGTYELGLSLGTGRTVTAGLVTVGPRGTLYGTYVDNEGLRIAGWVLFSVASAGYLVGALVGIMASGSGGLDALLIATGVYGGVSLLSLPFICAGDGAIIRFQ